MNEAMRRWGQLVRHVNGVETVGTPGVRDPDNLCESYDGLGYQGHGSCLSDGHYECTNCSHLSPDAPRFHEYGQDGRRDRLLLFWRRTREMRNG